MEVEQHSRWSGEDSLNKTSLSFSTAKLSRTNLRASLAAISSANSSVSPGLSPINSLQSKRGASYPMSMHSEVRYLST